VTLARGSVTFILDLPARARLRASLQMPLPGADPARAIVRVNQQDVFSEMARTGMDVDLDLKSYAGKRVALQMKVRGLRMAHPQSPPGHPEAARDSQC
jgi:hypothetical protein